MDRRSMMLMAGMGVMAAAMPVPRAFADPAQPDPPAGPDSPVPAAQTGHLFSDEFNGPAGITLHLE